MKKIIFPLIISLVILSCKTGKKLPDVSGIKVELALKRFDQDFFKIDTNNIPADIHALNIRYPILTPLFLQNILGLDSTNYIPGVSRFLNLGKHMNDTINDVFGNTDWLKKDFEKAFQYVKYYFPQYKAPDIVTVNGPIDALAQSSNGYTPDFLGPDFLGISLQFYLGKNFSLYKEPFFIENVAPAYRSRRFSKEYIIADAMMLVVDDLFPDNSRSKPLIEQMIEKGKQWYLLDKFLPTTVDSIKTGYTKNQLGWCNQNEGLIWSYIVKNEDLRSLNPVVIQTYIGEGPFTQGFSQELSPGNIGQWIGWQIIKKYAEKNPDLHPAELMKTTPTKILDEAGYKPK
ncbi:MAG TPA: hypothetical protein P5158_04670 [Chitinophagaceae bacterium]|nr:hypothetical protein [Chitinophagaceae bacterium]